MFDQLVESAPERERSGRQMMVSIVAHTVVIAVSLQLTRAAAEIVTKHSAETAMLLATPPAPTPPAHVAAASAAAAAAPSLLALPAAPVVVPTGIPPVDLGTKFDISRFNTRGIVPGNGVPAGDLAAEGDSLAFTLQQVDESVQYVSGPEPVYPSALRQVGLEGRVQLRYVVGTDGGTEPGTISVIASTNRSFEAPAIEAIRLARFKPGRVKGRDVRQIVEQVVVFRLNHS